MKEFPLFGMGNQQFDPTKFFSLPKGGAMGSMSNDKLLAFHQKNIEALTKVNEITSSLIQEIMKRNLEIVRDSFSNLTKTGANGAGGGKVSIDPVEAMQPGQKAAEQAMCHMRDISEDAASKQKEIMTLLSNRLNEIAQDMQETFSTATDAAKAENSGKPKK